MDFVMSWILFVAEVVVGSVLCLLILIPSLMRLQKTFQYFHRDPTSDIPGNPHFFDVSIVSLSNTLPEPSNMNIVWTNLPYDEPLLVRGRILPARCNSLSTYGQGSSDPPRSVNLAGLVDKNGCFEVVLSQDDTTSTSSASSSTTTPTTTLSTRGWKRGFVAMRNYLVPPGVQFYTPDIVRVRDGSVVRSPKLLVAGPAEIALKPVKVLGKLILLTALTLVVRQVNEHLNLSLVHGSGSCCENKWSIVFLASSLVGAGLLYKLLFRVGRKQLAKKVKNLCSEVNKFYLPSLEQASKSSQPSLLHQYWMMEYNVQPGSELIMTGVMNSKNQAYWSFVAYDLDGVPLGQYVYDSTAVHGPAPSPSPASAPSPSPSPTSASASVSGGDGGDYTYDIRLTCRRSSGHGVGPAIGQPPAVRDYVTDWEVPCPVGYMLFRLVHPDESIKDFHAFTPNTVLKPRGVGENAVDKSKDD